MNQPGTGRRWPVLALAACLAVMLMIGAVVLVRQQHAAATVQPGDDVFGNEPTAARQEAGPLKPWTDDTPDYHDLDVPDRPLRTTEPIDIPPPMPDGRRSDSLKSNASVAAAEEPVPHSQGIRQVASAPTREPKHPDRARADVKGFDNLPISLKWLADHQSREGAWRPDKFREDSQRKEAGVIGNLPRGDDDAGDEAATTRVTALALRAFAEAGYDHRAGDARCQVRSSILYLRRIQNNDGSFGGTSGMRDHAAIAGSLAATWGLSGDTVFKPIVAKAFDYLLAARVPGSGWRDTGEAEPDIITTWLAVWAIREATICGLEIDSEVAYRDVGLFLDSLVVGTVTMLSPAEHADAERHALAAAAWVSIALTTGHGEPSDARVKDRIAEVTAPGNLPVYGHGSVDYLYWLIGTCAVSEAASKEQFDAWQTALRAALNGNRRGFCAEDVNAGRTSPTDFAEHGSWDSVDARLSGGRVEATAMAAIAESVLDWYERMRTRDLRPSTPD